MLKVALIVLVVLPLLLAVPASSADTVPSGSLVPEGYRAIPTPDDSAIILVSDPTNGTGKGLQWLGVDGAIASNADNSIIVWSGGDALQTPPLLPARPILVPGPPATPPAQGNFLWPEGIDDAKPFDLDNSIILKGGSR